MTFILNSTKNPSLEALIIKQVRSFLKIFFRNLINCERKDKLLQDLI